MQSREVRTDGQDSQGSFVVLVLCRYLTLQDFSKVVESDSEFFSHMNLYLGS